MKISRELFQSLGTFAALFISIFALIVSIYEASILKEQQKATVWPYLAISQSYDDKGFSLKAMNNGIGPAIITSVQVDYKNKPVETHMDLLNKVKPNNILGYDKVKTDQLNETVMKAGEVKTLLYLPWTADTHEILEKLYNNYTIRVNYCSVLEECWTYEYPTNKREKEEFTASLEFQN